MFRSLHRMFWALAVALALTATVGLAGTSALALDSGWPRTLPVDAGMVTIYAPQVDGLDGDLLRYRAALAWRPSADAEPIFGAGWFESRVNIDRDQRIVQPLDLRLTNTRFPAGTADLQPGLAAALAVQAPGWNLDFSTDQLDTALAAAQAETLAQQKLNTAPPQIIYRDHPALLVTLDGEPVLRAIENSPYQAVINTPYPLISDGKHFYLNVTKGVWYRASAATGPYVFDPRVPADIAAMVKPGEPGEGQEAGKAGQAPTEPVTAANAPEIVVSTVPAELIVTEGPADFVPLVDDLLVLQNSADDVFMHVGTQQYYIVLAGRWYQSRSLNGPWTWQAADQLPAAFANIPQSSEQADSRVYVAGTPEAEEAVLDAQVPQTAAVALGPADIDVAYDGEPEFEPVAGTDLEYATNTGAAVLQSDRQYYLVEDGVWYVSDTPNGPWQVSAYRPATVNAIPPTSPVYNVKYVYIYDRTPDVVYVGYTPGYLGSYVYYNTVV
ncbi:MAG: carbohydrate-binding family V/XII, partial [Lysobacterales bacterium]